ncbi:MAG: Nicotinamide-nucleotide amidohydrolase PncC [Gammaproteobacteria bacterium]|nr:Nicotinamide-nucleotide amidohydrolase PncC [Gammaproteobacteria bacterium]
MIAEHSDAALMAVAARLGEQCIRRGWMLTTAESCTGGWIAKVMTDVPGSSRWFERGYVTYSNAAKSELLAVEPRTLSGHGAVSAATVRAMATGALAHSHAQLAVAVSGVAGPDGGSGSRPVGTVWFAYAGPGATVAAEVQRFAGDREVVRRAAVRHALRGLLAIAEAR